MRPAPIDREAAMAMLAPFGKSRTLPAEAYTSQDLYEWEMERFFTGSWTCVGRVADLLAPGQIRALAVGSETVLVSHDRDGELRVFSNTCRHRGHEILPPGEAVDVRLIRCPYHSWTYTLQGELKNAPTFTNADEFDTAEFPLIEVRSGVWEGWLFVNLDGRAPSIESHMGNLADYLGVYGAAGLERVAHHSYEVAANWKLIVENYHECYHCSTIHPALCRVSPPDSGRDVAPTGLWAGGYMLLRDDAETMSLDGRSGGAPFPGLGGEQLRQIWYVGVMPNLLLSPHPDYYLVHRLTPLAPDRTLVECEWLFRPEKVAEPGFDPAYAVDFWDLTNREDWTACEGVQRGAGNRGYRPGPLSELETTLYQFYEMLGAAYLGEEMAPPSAPALKLVTVEVDAP
jgi:Rieske 2Fe-2S family protein